MLRLSKLQLVQFALAVYLALSPPTAMAAWPGNPLYNLPVCTNPGDQFCSAIVSDGANGAIVTWFDYSNIFAQHVLASGAPDPTWPANGLQISIPSGGQMHPKLVSDGVGGAVVAWEDASPESGWIFTPSTYLPAAVWIQAWPARGQALCAALNNQLMPAIGSDGAGGAIVAWRDLRNGFIRFQYQVYAQHVSREWCCRPEVAGEWSPDQHRERGAASPHHRLGRLVWSHRGVGGLAGLCLCAARARQRRVWIPGGQSMVAH